MSKRFRNRYERSPRDFYRTPMRSTVQLIPHLRAAGVREFCEPCVGEGDLVRHLESFDLRCVYQGDIATGQDALDIASFDAPPITNPPFSILLPLLDHFLRAAPFTWLLLYADFAHKNYGRPYLPHCSDIVVAGRTAWFGEGTGTEEICWFRFDREHRTGPIFHNGAPPQGRRALICAACGKAFPPERTDQKFCKGACRQRAYRNRLLVTRPVTAQD
jgi:hypothetical protein